jgi:hypothetical protein
MSRWNSFGEGFLDGFTMRGFLGGLRRPGEADGLFEPEPPDEAPGISFHFDPAHVQDVEVGGDLHAVPELALSRMMEILKNEDASRKAPAFFVKREAHGAQR